VTQVPSREPIKVLADILKAEMLLEDGQLMLGLENWTIPANTGLYIALFYGADSVVGAMSEFDDALNTEIQSVAMLHTIHIDAMSFDESARLRKEEIIMALNSIFSNRHVSANLMQINSLPQSFTPLEELEETKQLNKFRITFSMNALHQKVKAVDYYDTFPDPTVLTNN